MQEEEDEAAARGTAKAARVQRDLLYSEQDQFDPKLAKKAKKRARAERAQRTAAARAAAAAVSAAGALGEEAYDAW